MKVKWGRETAEQAIVVIFLIISFLYGIHRIYGFSLYPDEFGYWASAAKVVGYDWSKIASLGSYYSFGYSLILIPILLIFHDATICYRVALGVNGLLLVAIFFLLQSIAERLFPDVEKEKRILAAGIASCYPTWLFYMNMTLVECLSAFCFVLVGWLLLKFMEKPGIKNGIFLVFATAYMYTVHMRTVAIVIAVTITVLVWVIANRPRNNLNLTIMRLCLGFVLCIGAATMVYAIKEIVQASVYSKADIDQLAVNDYAGQWEKIKKIFSREGFIEFGKSFIFKIYYLGMASFGTFYFGIFRSVKKLFDRTESRKMKSFYFFLLLSSIGQVLICAIYMKGDRRIDSLIYGRYDENILPILMMVGVIEMIQSAKTLISWCICMVIGLPVTYLLEQTILTKDLTNLHGGYFITGFTYLLPYLNFERENYFYKAYGALCILSTVVVIVMLFYRKSERNWWMVLCLIGIEIMLGSNLNEQFSYNYNMASYGNEVMGKLLKQKQSDGERQIVFCGNDDVKPFVSSIQFELRDTELELISMDQKESLSKEDLVLIDGDEKEIAYFQAHYNRCVPWGSFYLYYNEK